MKTLPRRTDDFLLTAEELRLRNRRRRLWAGSGIALVLMIVLGFFFAKPTAHAIRALQARRHANKAVAYIEQQKWKEARDEASAAYQLYPSEPQALRAVARFLSRVRNPEALDFWKQLRVRASLTRDDLRDEASIALASDEMERATAAIEPLIANNGKEATTADWFLAALLAQKKNSLQDAQRFLQKVFDHRKASERDILQASLLEMQIANLNDPETGRRQANDAWSHLTNLAKGKSAVALDALVLLAKRNLSTPVNQHSVDTLSTTDLVHAIENHPLAATTQKLFAHDLRIRTDPTQKEFITRSAVTQWKDADIASTTALGKWLNAHGEHQRELEAIPAEKTFLSRELFLERLDALAALGRWAEIKQLLESSSFPLEQMVQQMYMARCNSQLGEKIAAENNWRRALESASGEPAKLLDLAEYAEKNGNLPIADAAYIAAIKQWPKLRQAYVGRLRLAQLNRNTQQIHALLKHMLQLWPRDTALINDEAYTRLLLLAATDSTEEPRRVEIIASRLVQEEPRSLPHRTLLALSRLRQNRPQEAFDIYSQIEIAPESLTPGAMAVHAAVMAANGRLEDANREIDLIGDGKLLDGEERLIRLFVQSKKSGNTSNK